MQSRRSRLRDAHGLKPDHIYREELRDTALAIRERTLVVENVSEPGMKKPVRRHRSWLEYVDEAVGDGHITIKLSSGQNLLNSCPQGIIQVPARLCAWPKARIFDPTLSVAQTVAIRSPERCHD